MPSLRFSRDRRGYESTYLLHSSKRRPGAEHARLLYWFRTPPHVKIGRAAFDEDAIRLLEEQHPDVEFDWDRILTTKPPAAPEVRDPHEARPARRPDRRPGRDVRREPARTEAPVVPDKAPTAPSDGLPAPVVEEVTAPATTPMPVTAAPREPTAPPAGPTTVDTSDGTAPAPRRFVRVFDAQVDAPPIPEHHASEPAVAERMLGAERLTLLRARYAEILARISARGGDPARLEALRDQAAAVDPDAWVTEADVTTGLATVDATLNELHRIVGRRRRRRRRRRDGAPQPGIPPVVGADEGAPGATIASGEVDADDGDDGDDEPDDEPD